MKNGITKPGTNRKRRFTAPHHINRKFFSAPLSPSLKTQHGTRSMPVIKDDTVQVTKGDNRLSEGKVLRVNSKKGKIYIEGITRTRMDGSSVQLPIRPENVMITKLNLDDSRRREMLERRGYEAKKGGE
jgi:large subunit ribosomal protein L24